MPEVCEVTLTSLFLQDAIMNHTLTQINVIGGRYLKKPLKGLDEFNNKLPANIYNIDSKGKQMWFVVKTALETFYIMSHLGMDGRWGFKKDKNSNIVWTLKDKNNNILYLYFTDHRNYGTLEFITQKIDFVTKINNLGPDFLKTEFDKVELKNRIKNLICKNGIIVQQKANKNIVKVLMEGQKKADGIGSGLGNYLTAEILYMAKISPTKTIGEIYGNNELIERLTCSIKFITKLSYLTNITGYMENIKEFVKEIRNKVNNGKAPNYHKDIDIQNSVFSYQVYRKKQDSKGNKVETIEIIKGRNMYWVPDVQK